MHPNTESQPPILNMFATLQGNMENLDELIGLLAAKLEPISCAPVPEPEQDAPMLPKGESPVFTELWTLGSKQQACLYRLRRIISRLEV